MLHRFKIIVFIGLIVCLGLSLFANITLFRFARQQYKAVNALRLDPLGLMTYPAEADAAEIKGKTAVFIGDSRAAQWPAPTDLPQLHFLNRGIGSQTSAQITGRLEKHIRPLNPDILIVQMCINDLKTIPLFAANKELIIHNCRQNLETVVAAAAEMDTTLIVTTIFPVGPFPLERQIYWSPDIAAAVTDINDTIHTFAAENVIILDAYTLLLDEQTGLLNEAYAADELHLNEAGYARLNQSLTSILRDLTGETAVSQ